MRITNNERAPKILGVLKLSLVLALVAILPLSALMAGLLNSRNAVSTLGNNSVQQQVDNGNTAVSRDYSELAGKYIGLFVANDNGTVTLDIGNKANRAMIEDEDLQALQEYSEMIEKVNALVEDGTLYIAEDGNYYMVENEVANNLSRGLDGGRNEFYVRSQKFWFLWLPVGYFLALDTPAAISLGLFSLTIKIFTGMILPSDPFAAKKSIVDTLTNVLGGVVYNQVINALGLNVLQLYQTVQTIKNIDNALSIILASMSGGIANIIKIVVKIVVAILAAYLYDRVGQPFLTKGVANWFDESNNTVEMTSDLLLIGRDFRQYRW